MGAVSTPSTIGLARTRLPNMMRIAGRANISNATMVLTGFPGRPRRGTERPPSSRRCPNAKGLAGRIRTDQKFMSPRSVNTSFTMS